MLAFVQAEQLFWFPKQAEHAEVLHCWQTAEVYPETVTKYPAKHVVQLLPVQEVQLAGHIAGQNPLESGVTLVLLMQTVQLLGLLEQAEHAVALQPEATQRTSVPFEVNAKPALH